MAEPTVAQRVQKALQEIFGDQVGYVVCAGVPNSPGCFQVTLHSNLEPEHVTVALQDALDNIQTQGNMLQ